MLTFHYSPLSPYGQKVHFFLEESGKPYQVAPVSFAKPGGRDSLDKATPFGKVPAIELDGFTLSESTAILRYLAQRWNLESWYPQSLEDRARVDQVLDFASWHVARPMSQMAWHLKLAPIFGAKPNPVIADAAREDLGNALPRFERYLAQGRNYLCGPTPTIADAALLPFASAHEAAQVSLGDFPAFRAWLERMTARPSWAKVQAEVAKAMGAR